METNIESHLIEKRVFKPAKDFAKKARVKSLAQYRKMYRESMRRPDAFWMREAKELVWRKPWKKVLDWKAPFAKWFVGGKINASVNCLDRHLALARNTLQVGAEGGVEMVGAPQRVDEGRAGGDDDVLGRLLHLPHRHAIRSRDPRLAAEQIDALAVQPLHLAVVRVVDLARALAQFDDALDVENRDPVNAILDDVQAGVSLFKCLARVYRQYSTTLISRAASSFMRQSSAAEPKPPQPDSGENWAKAGPSVLSRPANAAHVQTARLASR